MPTSPVLPDFDAFLDQPYGDRQMIAFVDREVFEKAEEVADGSGKSTEWQWKEALTKGTLVVLGWHGVIAVVATAVVSAWAESRRNGLPVSLVPKEWANRLHLPPGHPRDQILYSALPAAPHVYAPVADFHRRAFEHKFAEALSLLMHLGATHIRVEHEQGWDRDFSGRLSVPIPANSAVLEAGAEAGAHSGRKRNLLYEARLNGTSSPSIPDDLVWYPHEPAWRQIASGRMNFGLENFVLKLHYEDDFNINAGLKLKAEKAGFDLGGTFERHETTTWTIEGTFASTS